MYNLFVTAQQDAWNSTYYEYDKSRFLEYTTEEISSALSTLSRENINTLKGYPCLFAYEGRDKNVRIGFLKDIKERGRNILIEFEIKNDIPPIPFSSIDPIAPLLDIRDWEMNRTHWAVKDEDLFERLISHAIINPIDNLNGYKSEKPQVAKASSPEVTTVQEFIKIVLSESHDKETEIFYRGHSDQKNYKLEPSLFRRNLDGDYLYLDNEHILYRELIVSNSGDFSSDESTLDKLVRMQHYSLPTRLLDITSNPLIALYFACISKEEVDGEVIVFSIDKDKIKYFDSDTASCIANLARLPKTEKNSIDFTITKIKDFNSQAPIRRLTHFIKEEKPFFEPQIIPEDLRKIICIKGKKNNDRISSQSGAFLIFGHDAILSEKGSTEITVKRITISNKKSILKELDQLNINDSTVFPNIENSAKYVAAKYKFNKSL